MYENWTVEWDMPTVVFEPFRRDLAGSWGTAPGQLLWTSIGGTAIDYNVADGRGTITLPTGDTVARSVLLPVEVGDFDLVVTVSASQLATGNMINGQIRFRSVDNNNFYVASVGFDTTGNIDLSINRLLAGVGSVLDSAANVVAYTAAGSDVHLGIQTRGADLRARVWTGDQEAPPTEWHAEVADANFTTGRIGVRATISSGNTNVNPVLSYDNLRVTVAERWVDVTSYVETADAPFTVTDGDTPESSADTGGFGLPLNNADQRFTPGNTLSPHYPNIAPGSRIRIRETAAGRTYGRGFGFVQYPEITAWTESNEGSPRTQTITIPVVDRAAWLAQGRRFVGTLAEHILYHGGPALKAYWPLNEQGTPLDTVPTAAWPLGTQTTVSGAGAVADEPAAPSIAFAGGPSAPGDDTPGVDFQPARDTATPVIVDTIELVGYRDTPLTLGAGQVCTLVAWINPDAQLPGINSPNPVWLNYLDANGDVLTDAVSAAVGIDTGLFYGSAISSDWSGTADGPGVPYDIAIPVAVRFGFSPAVIELWVGSGVYTDTMTVTSADAKFVNHMRIGRAFDGSVSHVQVYIGAPDDWTHDDFLAQRQMGLLGGDRQTTGERVRTILRYAGVDPAEFGGIDDGASVMQPMTLAGRGPIDVIGEAVETEQGEFAADGDGRFVFADRIRLYNT